MTETPTTNPTPDPAHYWRGFRHGAIGVLAVFALVMLSALLNR